MIIYTYSHFALDIREEFLELQNKEFQVYGRLELLFNQ